MMESTTTFCKDICINVLESASKMPQKCFYGQAVGYPVSSVRKWCIHFIFSKAAASFLITLYNEPFEII